jgi:hypothetical protein
MRTCRRVLAPRALEHQIDAALLHDCRALGHMPAQVELRMAAKHLPPDDEEKPRRQRRLQRVHVEALQLAHAVGDPALDDAAVRPVSGAARETQTRSAVSSSPFLALRHPRAPGPLGASPMTARSTARPPSAAAGAAGHGDAPGTSSAGCSWGILAPILTPGACAAENVATSASAHSTRKLAKPCQ